MTDLARAAEPAAAIRGRAVAGVLPSQALSEAIDAGQVTMLSRHFEEQQSA
jgi:hypothetical protein